MTYPSLRDWIAKIDAVGELKHITAEVDWNLELGAIARRVVTQQGPALLFENIKDYHSTHGRRVFANGLGTRERTAMALGLPRETDYRGIVHFFKESFSCRLEPVIVTGGPVKQNVIPSKDVNLYEFPVPKYNSLDGGRYINTHACVVTMDPDTGLMNVGIYRGMIGEDEKSIATMLVRSQHWGIHFSKYEQRGEEMPVAVFYGCDPVLLMCAGSALEHPGYSEYDVGGGWRGVPVELVKCETSDLYVPASAEIVIEGRISPDPRTFQMEGPFGEYTGFYGGHREPRPVIRVECITFRNDPVFPAHLAGHSPGRLGEDAYWETASNSASIWRYLESIGIPGITGVWGPPVTCLTNLRISIDKLYRGHAKQVAAAIWGSKLSTYYGKNIIVVDKDIDIFDDPSVEWALAYRTNAEMNDIQFFSGTIGSSLDASVPLSQRSILKYQAGKWTRVFVDATVNWDLEPEDQYGGRREPPLCTEIPAETTELIDRRWSEYGF
jgi:UbiD family decarboxylase